MDGFKAIIADEERLKKALGSMVPIEIAEALLSEEMNTNFALANQGRKVDEDFKSELKGKVMKDLKIDEVRYDFIRGAIFPVLYVALLKAKTK